MYVCTLSRLRLHLSLTLPILVLIRILIKIHSSISTHKIYLINTHARYACNCPKATFHQLPPPKTKYTISNTNRYYFALETQTHMNRMRAFERMVLNKLNRCGSIAIEAPFFSFFFYTFRTQLSMGALAKL